MTLTWSAHFCQNGSILKWQEKMDIIIDSCNRNRWGQFVKKLDCIFEYNDFMYGIHRIDQLFSLCTTKKVHEVVQKGGPTDIAVANACLLYKKYGGTRHQIGFIMNVTQSLLGSHDRTEAVAPSMAFRHHKA